MVCSGVFFNVNGQISLGLALFGFILGFTYLKTNGQFIRFRSIAYVEMIAIVEIVILVFIGTLLRNLWLEFHVFLILSLTPLIPLSIALALYGRFQKRLMK